MKKLHLLTFLIIFMSSCVTRYNYNDFENSIRYDQPIKKTMADALIINANMEPPTLEFIILNVHIKNNSDHPVQITPADYYINTNRNSLKSPSIPNGEIQALYSSRIQKLESNKKISNFLIALEVATDIVTVIVEPDDILDDDCDFEYYNEYESRENDLEFQLEMKKYFDINMLQPYTLETGEEYSGLLLFDNEKGIKNIDLVYFHGGEELKFSF